MRQVASAKSDIEYVIGDSLWKRVLRLPQARQLGVSLITGGIMATAYGLFPEEGTYVNEIAALAQVAWAPPIFLALRRMGWWVWGDGVLDSEYSTPDPTYHCAFCFKLLPNGTERADNWAVAIDPDTTAPIVLCDSYCLAKYCTSNVMDRASLVFPVRLTIGGIRNPHNRVLRIASLDKKELTEFGACLEAADGL